MSTCPKLFAVDVSLKLFTSFVFKHMTSLWFVVPHCPRLDTVEHIMKLSQMVVQALWDNKSPLLQLPHISEPMLRHFVTKRVRTKDNCWTSKHVCSFKTFFSGAVVANIIHFS